MKKINFIENTDTLNIKLFDNGILPKYENNFLFINTNKNHILAPKSVTLISTGISMELKTNKKINRIIDIKFCQTREMTSKNLYMINYPGTIDMDYRGELKVIIYNFNDYEVNINQGDRIAILNFNYMKKFQVEFTKNKD